MNQQLALSVDRWIAENTPDMVNDIKQLVSIPSVAGPRDGEYPFGKGCARVLDAACAIAGRMGFETRNDEYYCGSALHPGKRPETLAMLGHLDIVPEGEGWTRPPFQATEENGNLYGRGAGDNKGPAMMSLYTMKCIRDLDIKLNHTVEVFFGCQEECGMQDVDHYLTKHPAPDFSIVADGVFSVSHAEKGILTASLSCDIGEGNLLDFQGGLVSNMVPDRAFALLGTLDPEVWHAIEESPGFSIQPVPSGIEVSATGKCGHAAMPEGSRSAIHMLAGKLLEHGCVSGKAADALTFLYNAFSDWNGEGLNIAYADAITGKLTHIGSTIRMDGTTLVQGINIRYPVETPQQEMIDRLTATCQSAGFLISDLRNSPPAYMPLDHPAIALLNDICNQVLGTDYKPYAMGGGTYARKLPNAVAYGPDIREKVRPDGADRGNAHQPDECVNIAMLQDGIRIYVRALMELDKLA